MIVKNNIMKYVVDNITYDVVIEKKGNKNTYIRIKDDNVIYVTTNYLMPKFKIKKLLDDNKDVIIKMIEKNNKRQEKNEHFYYLGKKYDLVKIPTFKSVEVDNNKIYYPNEKTLNNWYKKEMVNLFSERLNVNYNNFQENIPFPKLKIRTMKTRWGVCNRRDNSVTLNSELMKYEIDKLDYVIIHELSHFVHFNHSKEFWNVVSKYCPNYKNLRKELKD